MAALCLSSKVAMPHTLYKVCDTRAAPTAPDSPWSPQAVTVSAGGNAAAPRYAAIWDVRARQQLLRLEVGDGPCILVHTLTAHAL
jgi:hypothetical protein